MVHVHHRSAANVPAEFAFAYVSDFTHIGDWMFGIQSAQVNGDITHGLGAVYDGSIKLGTTLRSTIEVTGWEPGSLITTESRSGFVNRSTWRFAAIDPNRTEMLVDIDYELPGGLAGRTLGKLIEPFITIAIKHSDEKLRSVLQDRYRASRTRAGAQ